MNSSASPKTRRHPKALYMLFFSEFWERFSFYGLQSLFVLFITQMHHFPDKEAYVLYGMYLAFCYATPIIGGFIADKWMGYRKAIILGAVLIIIGNIFLAIPTAESTKLMYLGLSFIIWGTGFFKPNVSSIVGTLYEKNSPLRDSGFTIFYMGINSGGVLGSLSYGLLAQVMGWFSSFTLGAIGMTVGLLIFISRQKLLGDKGHAPTEDTLFSSKRGLRLNRFFYPILILLIGVTAYCAAFPNLSAYLINVSGILVLLTLLGLAIKFHHAVRQKIIALFFFFIYYLLWAACFFQMTGAITLFTERNVARHFVWPTSFTIPTPWFYSLEAIFIISFAPVMAKIWDKLVSKNIQISSPTKLSMGLLFSSVSFFIFFLAASSATLTGQCSAWWLPLAYAIFAIGELCLSPIGLSAITRYAPEKFVGFFMGAWFFASAYSGYLASLISKMASIPETHANDTVNLKMMAGIYANVFKKITLAMFIATLLSCFLIPYLKRLLHTKEEEA